MLSLMYKLHQKMAPLLVQLLTHIEYYVCSSEYIVSYSLSTVGAQDYTPFDQNIRYRGGRRRDIELSFNVNITQDGIDEPAEDFFLNLVATENIIVLTPVITIHIVGTGAGMNDSMIAYV